MRFKKRNNKRPISFVVVTITVVLVAVATIKIVNPVLSVFAETTAMNHATRCVNETVEQYLQSMNLHYSDVAQIQTDSDGDVTAIRIDSIALNQLKTGITAQIADLFSEIQTAQMHIPVGTLSGSKLLAGKGTHIPFSVSYSASAESELSNLFVTRGINQTLHRIILQIRVRVQALSNDKTQINEIKTQITVAETVIVGTIPEIYAGADDEIWPNLVE